MNRVIRAKIKIASVQTNATDDLPKQFESISAAAVYSEDKEQENYSFSQSTPHLSLSMTINNPGAFDRLIAGKEYYLDFIPVETERAE